MGEKDPREQVDEMPENQNSHTNENDEDRSETYSFKYIVLALSLILWGYLICIGVKNGIATSIHRGRLDLYSFVHPIGDFWFDTIFFRGYLLFGFLFIALALYPIFFIIEKRNEKKEANESSDTSVPASENPSNCHESENETLDRSQAINNAMEYMNEAERKKRFIKFSLSFIPYLYILWSGIFGFYFGGYIYGFRGMLFAAAILSLAPVYPVLLVFQVMLYIYYVKSGKFVEEQRRGTARIVTILISAVFVIGIGHAIIASVDELNEEEAGRGEVEQYLVWEYEKYAEDMEIVGYNNGAYKIETPLLEKGYFYVHMYEGTVYDGTSHGDDGFKDVFQEENNLTGVISDYMCDTYMRMYNCDFEITLYDYDFKEYLEYGGSNTFVKSCEFKVDHVSLYDDEYDRQRLLWAAISLCVNFKHSLPGFRGEITQIRIYIDDEWAYDVDMADRFEIDHGLELDVSTVNDNLKSYEKIRYDFSTGEATVTPIDSEEFTIQLVR